MAKTGDLNDKEKMDYLLSKVDEIVKSKQGAAASVAKQAAKFDELQDMLSDEQKVFRVLKQKLAGFQEGQTLVFCSPRRSKELLAALTKLVIENEKKPALVLTTLNYRSALGLLEESGINGSKVFLIDTVSKNLVAVKEEEKLLFVDSLRDLTQLQIKIVKLIAKNPEVCLVFDSLGVLQLYHADKVIYKFVYSVTKNLHKHKVSAFYLLSNEKLVSQLAQFFDNFADVSDI